MLQAAAAISGGYAIRQSLEAVPLPSIRRPGEQQTYKLTVRVLAAAVPGLAMPGVTSWQRPYLEAQLGDSTKDTEFADFCGSEPPEEVGKCAKECPWRFSDSITFRCRLQDLMGPGLKLRLYTRNDITMWPVQFKMRPVQVAEGLVDLKSRVLPACERRLDGPEVDLGTRAFLSPLVLVAMSHIKGGTLGETVQLGEAVAHVALVFSLDVDPEEIFVSAGLRPGRAGQVVGQVKEKAEATKNKAREKFLGVKESAAATGAKARETLLFAATSFDQTIDTVSRVLDEPSLVTEVCKLGPRLPPTGTMRNSGKMSAIDEEAAKRRAETRAWAVQVDGQGKAVPDPDLDPEGWVSHRTPEGRQFWHHLSMGPPPWEASGSPTGAQTGRMSWSSPSTTRSSRTAKSSSFASPDESPEAWVSFTREDGRVFWHHQALGPAPWTIPELKEQFMGGGSPTPTC